MLYSDLNLSKNTISDLELASAFLEIIPKAMSEVRKELRCQRTSDLDVPHFRVMANIRLGSKTNKELAEHLGVNVGTMSRMIQLLVDKGLIEKSAGLEDRREVRVQLSKQGRSLFEKIKTQMRNKLSLRMSLLSDFERHKMKEGFEVLARVISN